MNPDSSTLERIVPEHLDANGATGQATLELHLARYRFAASHLKPGSLLDIACGVGYGTSYLVHAAPQIAQAVGVDLSESALAYARERYAHERIEFVHGDAMTFTGERPFDNIVSLETIEHLPDPRGFLARAVQMLRSGGVLVGSVPVTPSMDGNPHHLTDFSERSFRALGKACGLREVASFPQVQTFSPVSILNGSEKRVVRNHSGLLRFYSRHPAKLALRIWSTARFGFQNRYLTIVWTK